MENFLQSLARPSVLITALAAPAISIATEPGEGLYVKPIFGLSQMSDQVARVDGAGLANGPVKLGIDPGFNAGLLLGYRTKSNWAFEVGWEYRSNDTEIVLADGQRLSDGNYASNQFFLNGLYFFASRSRWEPYVGAGLLWGQEIDIDLEGDGFEQSFDGQGDIGVQVFAGLNYKLSNAWSVGGELRYGRTTGIDLGVLKGLEYAPTTLQVGLTYRF